MTDATEWRREPGRGKYAQIERERRFLLRSSPPAVRSRRRIADRYLLGTTLRLRHVEGDGDSVFKLTQKVREVGDDPAAVRITNIYLTREEFALLSDLPGAVITKDRHVHEIADATLVVDEFHGRLEGLRLAEVEVSELGRPLVLPEWVGPEVTHDDRYSGARLATSDPTSIRDLLGRD